MRKLAVWVLIPVFLLALLAGAAYGFYWYQVKTFVDRMVEQAAPLAQLEYGAVYADPRGEVGVDDLLVTLRRDGSQIPIRSIRLRATDPLFFLDPQGRIDAGDWPRQLDLAINESRIDLSSPLFSTLESRAAEATAQLPGSVELNALACGELKRLGIAEFRQMGYSELLLNLALALQFDEENRRVRLHVDTDLPGLGKSFSAVEFSFSGSDLRPAQMLAASPRLRRLEVGYQDGGYNRRRDRFCAEQAGVEEGIYRAEHLRLLDSWLLAQGIRLPEPLKAVYGELHRPGGRMELTLEPPGGLGAEVMATVGSPTQLMTRLNPSLRVNARPVALDQVDWAGILVAADPNTLAQVQGVDEVADAVDAAPEDGAVALLPDDLDDLLRGMPKRKPAPEAKRYRPLPLARLKELDTGRVRVRTALGNQFEGWVVGADEQSLTIEQRVDNGLIVFPLAFDQIQSIEVYR